MDYIVAKGINKSFKNNKVLHDISLNISQNEIFSIIGTNGSGKTTLIKILAGLLNPDSGHISILGHDYIKDQLLIKKKIGYIGQDTERSAFPRLTVKENLFFFGKLFGLDNKYLKSEIEKLCYYFDFEESINKVFTILSGGQKQITIIMRALLHNPEVIFMDEPTKGLDPLVAMKIKAMIKKYASEHKKSIILTSHILSEISELSDRIAIIKSGKIIKLGTLSELKKDIADKMYFEIKKSSLTGELEELLDSIGVSSKMFIENDKWISFGLSDTIKGITGISDVIQNNIISDDFRIRNVSLEDVFIQQLAETKKLDA